MKDSGIERILFYGATDAARIITNLLDSQAPVVVGVVDGRYERSEFYGVKVLADIASVVETWDAVLIAVSEGVEEGRVWRLF